LASTKRKFIKVGQADRVIVKAGQNSNKIHIEVTLTRDQEISLLKMLQERHPKLRF
jgi:hypothetical protein